MRLPGVTMTPEAEALRGEVRAFVAGELRAGSFVPRVDSWLSGFDPDFSRRLGARGWLGMTWPARYGGGERTALERYVVIEELLAAGAPVGAHWVADRQTGPLLLRFGTEEQRERLLPAMARGELYFAIGMSEPDAGSDLAAVRTRAERVDGGWRLHGTKVWTSGAHLCHHAVVLCRTSPPGDDRHAGLSQMLLDLRADAGVDIRPILSMTGEHHFNEVVLDGAFVPDAMVVGQIGDGWRQVTSELAYERSGPERFLSTLPLLVALVDRIGADTGEQEAALVGELVAGLAALRWLSLSVAAAIEGGAAPAVEAALVKDLGTRFEREIIAATRRLAPCEPALDADDPLAVLLAEAVLTSPGGTLRGGTNEILRTIVARALATAPASGD
ncbi:MAG TPA: acyl-CoA dehydrogenase family protein [Solirubrobacteraceae bacterium]|jgi:alkylation response protein AidB-like acyl-CoA dehydrogenase